MAKRTLDKLSLQDLKTELERRERELQKLYKQREDIDRRIAELGGERSAGPGRPRKAAATTAATGTRRRRRPRNKQPLAEVLLSVFPKDKPMKVSDAVAAARKQGYKTTARNFATIVNQTLIKDPRFQQVSRGYYKLA